MASEHPLDVAIARLLRLVGIHMRGRRDFSRRDSFIHVAPGGGWWNCAPGQREAAELRSFIAAIRVLRRERDDDMEYARLTAGVFLSRGQPLSPETAARWTRTQRREARMWVTGALSRAPRHVTPADLGGDHGE